MLVSRRQEANIKSQKKRQLVSVLLWGPQKEPQAEQQAERPLYAVAWPAAPPKPAHVSGPSIIYGPDSNVATALPKAVSHH